MSQIMVMKGEGGGPAGQPEPRLAATEEDDEQEESEEGGSQKEGCDEAAPSTPHPKGRGKTKGKAKSKGKAKAKVKAKAKTKATPKPRPKAKQNAEPKAEPKANATHLRNCLRPKAPYVEVQDVASADESTLNAPSGHEATSPPALEDAPDTTATPRVTAIIGVPPPEASDDYMCGNCNAPIPDISEPGVRLMSKQSMTYRCGACNCKNVILRRKFGTWPITGFELFTTAQQKDFHRSIHDVETKDLIEHVIHALTIRKTELMERTRVTESLPLGVWAQRGYDANMIRDTARPQDVTDHPRLGKIYALQLQVVKESKVEETVREQVLKLVNDAKARRVQSAQQERAPRANAGGVQNEASAKSSQESNSKSSTRSSGRSSESSRSESSSSKSSSTEKGRKRKKHSKSKKQKKRCKKTKKDKKRKDSFRQREKQNTKEKLAKRKLQEEEKQRETERRGQERERAMAAKKARKQVAAQCTKVLSKATPLNLKLSRAIEGQNASDVPKQLCASAKSASKSLAALCNIAEKHIDGNTPLEGKDAETMDDSEAVMSSASGALKGIENFIAKMK